MILDQHTAVGASDSDYVTTWIYVYEGDASGKTQSVYKENGRLGFTFTPNAQFETDSTANGAYTKYTVSVAFPDSSAISTYLSIAVYASTEATEATDTISFGQTSVTYYIGFSWVAKPKTGAEYTAMVTALAGEQADYTTAAGFSITASLDITITVTAAA